MRSCERIAPQTMPTSFITVSMHSCPQVTAPPAPKKTMLSGGFLQSRCPLAQVVQYLVDELATFVTKNVPSKSETYLSKGSSVKSAPPSGLRLLVDQEAAHLPRGPSQHLCFLECPWQTP